MKIPLNDYRAMNKINAIAARRQRASQPVQESKKEIPAARGRRKKRA